MAYDIYIGVDNSPHLITSIYIGVQNIARKVISAFVGINGIAKKIFTPYYKVVIPIYEGQYIEVECGGKKYTQSFLAKAGSTYTATLYAYDGFTTGVLQNTSGIVNSDIYITATEATPIIMDVVITYIPQKYIHSPFPDEPSDNEEFYRLFTPDGVSNILKVEGITPTNFSVNSITFSPYFNHSFGGHYCMIRLQNLLPYTNKAPLIAVQVLVNEQPNYDDRISESDLDPYYFWFTNAGINTNGYRDITYTSDGTVEFNTGQILEDSYVWYTESKQAYDTQTPCTLRIKVHYLPGDTTLNIRSTETQDVTLTLDSGVKYEVAANSERTFTTYSGQTYTAAVQLSNPSFEGFYSVQGIEPSTGILEKGKNTLIAKPVKSILPITIISTPDNIPPSAFDSDALICRIGTNTFVRDNHYLCAISDDTKTVSILHSDLQVFNSMLNFWSNGFKLVARPYGKSYAINWGQADIEAFSEDGTLHLLNIADEAGMTKGSLVGNGGQRLSRLGGYINKSTNLATYTGMLYESLTYTKSENYFTPRYSMFVTELSNGYIMAGGYGSENAATTIEYMSTTTASTAWGPLQTTSWHGISLQHYTGEIAEGCIIGSPIGTLQRYFSDGSSYLLTVNCTTTADNINTTLKPDWGALTIPFAYGYLTVGTYGIGYLDMDMNSYRFIPNTYTAENLKGNLIRFNYNLDYDNSTSDICVGIDDNLLGIIDTSLLYKLALWMQEHAIYS